MFPVGKCQHANSIIPNSTLFLYMQLFCHKQCNSCQPHEQAAPGGWGKCTSHLENRTPSSYQGCWRDTPKHWKAVLRPLEIRLTAFFLFKDEFNHPITGSPFHRSNSQIFKYYFMPTRNFFPKVCSQRIPKWNREKHICVRTQGFNLYMLSFIGSYFLFCKLYDSALLSAQPSLTDLLLSAPEPLW